MNTFTKEELISILAKDTGIDLMIDLLAAQDAQIASLQGIVDIKDHIIKELDIEVIELEETIDTYKGFVKEDAAIIKALQEL